MKENITMEELVNLCKQYGIIFQGSEIYGGLANTWDFGPVGAELKNNIKKAWKQKFIQEDANNVGLDSAILMNPKVWEASGHISTFSDPLIDCKNCKTRYRADKLVEDDGVEDAGGMSNEDLIKYINEHNIVCPKCGKLDYTDIRQFNLMFKTFQGVTEDSKSTIYLRPETAQGIFADYQNIQRSMRLKLPFGVGQVGKSFRNEITPGNFIFRVREFEQMELEFFCKPGTELDWFKHYKEYCKNFLLLLGVKEENLRLRDHSKEELSFYSNATTDIEYKFPFGWGELWGIASRTNYDLSQHQKFSGEDLNYFDIETKEKYLPSVIEPSCGLDRIFLAVLCDAFNEIEGGRTQESEEKEFLLKLKSNIAPVKVAVLPLVKNKEEITSKAKEVYNMLKDNFSCQYDETGAIGRRYRRQDEIGTPWAVTIDFESIVNNDVTLRNRDTMEQQRVKISDLISIINEN